jgi:hypothetical protein
MNRILAALFVSAFVAASGAFAEPFMNKLRFAVETLPDQDGGGFKGRAGFKFSDRFSSMLYMKQLVTAETGELDMDEAFADNPNLSVTSSLNLLRSSVAEYFILPLEYSLGSIGEEGLTLGLGAYLSTANMDYVGYFVITQVSPAATETESYHYVSKGSYYGPVVTAQASFDLGFVSFSPRIVAVPYFFFSESQAIQIEPIFKAWGEGVNTVKSSGFPYIEISLKNLSFPIGNLLRMPGLRFGGDFAYDLNRLDTQSLSQAGTVAAPTWSKTDITVTTTNFSYLAELGYKFENASFVSLGFGARHTKSVQEDGPTFNSIKPIYSIKYELHLN